GKASFSSARAGLFPSYDWRAWCQHDAECPSEEKCCLHGCDYTCLTPSQAASCSAPCQAEKPGICPLAKEALTTTAPCSTTCAGNWQCLGAEKCCSSRCGHVCLAPK
ncbi:WAP protein, partial [Sula dactylatra]|nr:WAP protein [Sula dactylatra]